MANFVLDKGFLALSTYNSSAVAGVLAYRFVKFGAGGTIDIQSASNAVNVGVVMEQADQAKVATGKATLNVRMIGIAKVIVGTGGVTQGARVMSSTTGTAITAATSGNFIAGIALQTGAVGDLIDVLLTPGGGLVP
ncbi:MAG: hypothetical protein ABW007_27500 [Chitinophagaceae bacterium]